MCVAAIKGLPCTVYNRTYDNGETFLLDCRTQCACQVRNSPLTDQQLKNISVRDVTPCGREVSYMETSLGGLSGDGLESICSPACSAVANYLEGLRKIATD
jgi:hypothetical protein